MHVSRKPLGTMATNNLPYSNATPYQASSGKNRTLKGSTPSGARTSQSQSQSLATSAGGETATFLQFVRLCASARPSLSRAKRQTLIMFYLPPLS